MARQGMHHHLPSYSSLVEVEALPSGWVMLSRPSTVVWPHPTSHRASPRASPHRLIPRLTTVADRRPGETSLVTPPAFTTFRSPYAEEFFEADSSDSPPLPWPSPYSEWLGSPFFPLRGLVTTLQDSLYVTDCCFARPSRADTPLRHNQSPRSTGSLLRGSQRITTTGLAPASKRCLQGTPEIAEITEQGIINNSSPPCPPCPPWWNLCSWQILKQACPRAKRRVQGRLKR